MNVAFHHVGKSDVITFVVYCNTYTGWQWHGRCRSRETCEPSSWLATAGVLRPWTVVSNHSNSLAGVPTRVLKGEFPGVRVRDFHWLANRWVRAGSHTHSEAAELIDRVWCAHGRVQNVPLTNASLLPPRLARGRIYQQQ